MCDEIFKNGMTIKGNSGPDETSLFYYFMKQNVKIFKICDYYAVISAKTRVDIDHKKHFDDARGYNFPFPIKSWTKPKFFMHSYDITADSMRLKLKPDIFEQLRDNYSPRR